MKIGCHVSIAGGVFNAPGNAANLGAETFQMFSRSPQGGPAPKLTPAVIKRFNLELIKHGITEFIIHTPYYINFSSTTPRIRYGSISIVRDELERGTKLGAAYVVTHLGSAKDTGPALGIHKTWRAVQRILDGYRGSTGLLLEITAGAGDLIGDTFEELAEIISQAESDQALKGKVNICLDTCHLFAAGYDLRSSSAVQATLTKFDQIVGGDRLKCFHINDSKFGLKEHKDRHEHIGRGHIGLNGFKALAKHPLAKRVNWYLETEPDGVQADIALLKTLRS